MGTEFIDGNDLPDEIKQMLIESLLGKNAKQDLVPLRTMAATDEITDAESKRDGLTGELKALAKKGEGLMEQRSNQSTRYFDAIARAFGFYDMDDCHAKGFFVGKASNGAGVSLYKKTPKDGEQPTEQDIVLRRGNLNN